MPKAFTYKYTAFDRSLCFILFYMPYILNLGEIHGAYAAGSMCFILAYFYYFLQRETFRRIAFTFPMKVWISLTVYHLVNATVKHVPEINIIDWLHGFKIYACMVIVCYWCILDFKKTVKTLCLVYAIILLFFLLLGYDSLDEGDGRLNSSIMIAVGIGHWSGALAIFISLYCIMNNVSLIKTMLMFAYCVVFSFLAQARVGMIMVCLSVLGYVFTYVKRGGKYAENRMGQIAIAGFVGLYILLTVYSNSGLSRRVEEGDSYQESYYFQHADINPVLSTIAGERTSYYYYGWIFFQSNPLTGIGLDNYANLTGGEYPMHPDIMLHIAEGGIIAVIIYLMFHIYLLYHVWKLPKTERYKYVAFVALLTILVMSIWAGVFRKEFICSIYGIILYLIYKHNGTIRVVE